MDSVRDDSIPNCRSELAHKPEVESLFDGKQIRSTCLCIAAQDRPAARRRYASKGTRESW
jgi:hypothetical protein